MTRQTLVGGAAGAVITALVLVGAFLLFQTRPTEPAPSAADAHESASSRMAEPATVTKTGAGETARAVPPPAGRPSTVSRPAQPPRDKPSEEARSQAVTEWETYVDAVIEQAKSPTADQAIAFRDAFHKLASDERMEGIRTALNLLPDQQFPLLYPILFDKLEQRDLLDEVFCDALNRDENIKVPIMKEIIKDKEHPMYSDAMHILEVTGELDAEAVKKTAAPVEGNIE